ncbi:alpha/beta hydrolase [Dyella jiangningensis]|uniref:Alpha/beta hydrolase n=2 Tax=Dyella jiangningensis TaxID=1379159 RepID=A0A328PBA5_9GAMM|nr:alpha/beta hydrolase [Dyella jiangningensis]
MVPQRIPDSYAQAGSLIDIGRGRQLNLRCTGQGARTVILEAGSHADTTTWFKVQPLVATFAKVCSYDRAGYGFSSEGPMPRNLDADVSDLHDLIARAGLKTPVVLVGHSLGSNIARRYAQMHAGDVSGMVLVDPPAQDVAAFAPEWSKDEEAMNAHRFDFIRQCLAGAEKGQLASPPAELQRCTAAPNSLASEKVNAVVAAYKYKPAFWRTLLSELQDNAVVFSKPVSPQETAGQLPLIVLAASDAQAGAPPDVRKALEAATEKTQARIAATSSRGERQVVANSSHDMQLDQPEAIAKAVEKVLKEAGTAENSRAQ